jgi:hypothetical protein
MIDAISAHGGYKNKILCKTVTFQGDAHSGYNKMAVIAVTFAFDNNIDHGRCAKNKKNHNDVSVIAEMQQ